MFGEHFLILLPSIKTEFFCPLANVIKLDLIFSFNIITEKKHTHKENTSSFNVQIPYSMQKKTSK